MLHANGQLVQLVVERIKLVGFPFKRFGAIGNLWVRVLLFFNMMGNKPRRTWIYMLVVEFFGVANIL